MKNKNSGFTLIELSIVIVIIGLIVASVLGGQSLIRSAKIRSIVSDYNKVLTAIKIFKLEYNAIPGDFSKAVEYGIGNTNGDSDKKISTRSTEALYFWEQLSKANLFEGTYTGATSNPMLDINVNIPESSFGNNIAMHVGYIKEGGPSENGLSASANDLFGTIDDFNFLTFAATTSSTNMASPFLKVSEAHGLDKKIDDGNPDLGIFYSANDGDSNTNGNRCVDNSVRSNGGANYDFDETGETCRIIFNIGK